MPPDGPNDWLQRGGDHRLVSDDNGFSPYRVTFHPRDTMPFGSCTASSPGPRALGAAAAAFGEWEDSGRSDRVVDALQARTRARLREIFELPEDSVCALTPSGTDALYLVNALIHAKGRSAHHVVVGASELGGGTVRACQGRTFSSSAPAGEIEESADLPGVAERSSAEPLYLRTPSGKRVEEDAVDREVERRVAAAVGPETCVVVHLVAHSKTGLRAPSMACAQRLSARHGDRVLIFVDAAQGRIAPADMRTALRAGFVVMFTGSKFYSGPPFSGALFFPVPWASDPGPLAPALGAWLDQASLPEGWPLARRSVSHRANLGLALRWQAAMAEILAYHEILPRRRAAVYATFAGAVHEVLGPGGPIQLEFPLPPTHALATRLGAFPSVFSFRVRGASGWLGKPELKALHALLDTPGPGEHPAFYLGQPVALGPPGQGRKVLLRVALGARTVSDLADHPDAGGRFMREQLRGLRAKVEFLLRSTAIEARRV